MVNDPTSIFYGVVPMPVIMIAQMECIMYTRVLRPMSKKVLNDLHMLVKRKNKSYWLTIYLTIFILLHSCSMITRRDEEFARQYNLNVSFFFPQRHQDTYTISDSLHLQERFANPYAIKAHHSGAQTILAHFHYVNKGCKPFSLADNASGVRELQTAAKLTEEQVEFVRKTAMAVRSRGELRSRCRSPAAPPTLTGVRSIWTE